MSLHRTWIQADGCKAAVEPPRLLLAGHRKQGGVVRLWPDEAVTAGLGIAEGIETALSLAWAYAPVWACIDAGNLAALPYLTGIDCLLIGADNDPAGKAAAKACAANRADADAEVFVTRQVENDLNDVLTEVAA
ncbi:toprim domain-containing protein [Cupriavidus campinensis]